MSTVARGHTVLFGFRPERRVGVPSAGPVRFLKPALPINFQLKPGSNESPAANPSGYREPDLPGLIESVADLGFLLTTGDSLDFVFAVMGSVSKATVAGGGVFQYTFDPLDRIDVSHQVVYALPPVLRQWFYGLKFGGLEIEVPADNGAAAVRLLDPLVLHGTDLGSAIPDAGNVGDWSGPFVRGPLADRTSGDPAIRITRLTPSIQFHTDRGPAPAFGGAAVDVATDETGRAVWQNFQDASGADLGRWNRNKDPLGLILPGLDLSVPVSGTWSVAAGTQAFTGNGGAATLELAVGQRLLAGGEVLVVDTITGDDTFTTAATHAAGLAAATLHKDEAFVAVGDTFTFPVTWPDPSPTYESFQEFTSAHFRLRVRELGASTWIEHRYLEMTFRLLRGVTPEAGGGSRYRTDADQDGLVAFELDLSENLRARRLLDWARAQQAFELQIVAEGQQLGDLSVREGFVVDVPNAYVTEEEHAAGGAERVQQSSTILGTTNEAGDPPFTWRAWTTRDWTPPA